MLTPVYLWNKAPAIRLLLCFAAGIISQWYFGPPLTGIAVILIVSLAAIAGYSFLPVGARFRLRSLNGLAINTALAALGGLVVWAKDIRNDEAWIGHSCSQNQGTLVTLEEPLTEKTASYKALATVQAVLYGDSVFTKKGKIIIYFKKDSAVKALAYGSQLLISKPLQELTNSGNPGAFDFKRYNLFQGITHQVYITGNDFAVLPKQKTGFLHRFIFTCQSWVVRSLRQYISGEKEQGLAEALLIGYKDDLDKTLVQSYTNTGVVHIIAISGMHLGLIYALLVLATGRLKKYKRLALLRITIILAGLWLFSIMAGAQPSILRAAVIFTFLAAAELFGRQTSVYNSLALSAFVLLCWNPFWLWDVGFQLSYAAVLSIVIFYKPIYRLIYVRNKLLDLIWQLTAISLAAQLFTTPVSLYHFHQFPVLFLLTNLVAVPLSTLILYAEIAVCLLSFVPPAAKILGWLTGNLIFWMNSYIESLEAIPFALWNGFYISVPQTVLLTIAVGATGYWLLNQWRPALWMSMGALLFFFILRAASFMEAAQQRKLIVYNVPKHTAIDLIDGRQYSFIGDTILLSDDFARNFYLQPSRVMHRITPQTAGALSLHDFQFYGKKIILIDSALRFLSPARPQAIDLVILSKNPKLYIAQLAKTFTVGQIIVDGSVPSWKAKLWKKDCDSLRIPCYNVAQKGAFVMNL